MFCFILLLHSLVKEKTCLAAGAIIEEIIVIRRYLHQNAEVGFDLDNTIKFVKDKLYEFGYKSYEIGKCGLMCELNNDKEKTLLFRADMDGLPIKEEANVDFKCDNNMHACGHDIHTAILLGVAKILKDYQDKLDYNIRFMFQPAEEILEGAKDMIENGILNDIEEAYMIHVLVPTSFDTGTVIISDDEVTAPSCDYFNIDVIGKSVHSAMPNLGVDPIKIASNIVNNFVNYNDDYTLTFGSINGGNTFNIIPDKVNLKGTLRTYNENIRHVIKDKMLSKSEEIAKSYNGNVKIEFPTSAPVLINNLHLVEEVSSVLLQNGMKIIKSSELPQKSKASGSEDFAYISQKVPSLMISLCSGKIEDGYEYPLHNENVIFDEDCMYYGIYIYLLIGLKKAQ